MRRLMYAHFPCLMLKKEVHKAMKLIFDMENMGLYDQEAKLKYGDLLKFEDMTKVISREMVLNKCAEVVQKDLEDVQDHFFPQKKIPIKYEKLDPTSLISNLSNVLNAVPPSYTQTNKGYQMNLKTQPSSIWSIYPDKNKKRQHEEILETTEINIRPTRKSQPNHRYTIDVSQPTKISPGKIHSATLSKQNTLLVTATNGASIDLAYCTVQNKIVTKSPSNIDHHKEMLVVNNETVPPFIFGSNSSSIVGANAGDIVIFSATKNMNHIDKDTTGIRITSLLVEEKTSEPMAGTADGRIIYRRYGKGFDNVVQLGVSPIIKLADCSNGTRQLRYALDSSGMLHRFEISDQQFVEGSLVSIQAAIVHSTHLFDFCMNPVHSGIVAVRNGESIQIVTCSDDHPRPKLLMTEKKNIPGLTCACFSHDGLHLICGNKNGEIYAVSSTGLSQRGAITTMENQFPTCISNGSSKSKTENTYTVGTSSGNIVFIELKSTK